MKSCNSYKKMFSEYIDNALDSDKRTRLEDHLASCTQCQSLIELLKNTQTSLRSLEKIRTSETFDAVMHARLVQQARHENKRVYTWAPLSIFVNFKTPAFVAAAVMLVFLGTVLQKYYGAAPQNADAASMYQDIPQAVVAKTSAENPGYMVVTPRDTTNNTILVTNYVHLDEVSPRRHALQTSDTSFYRESLPDLKDAPTRQASNRSFSRGRNVPKIQYAKEYVF